MWKTIEQIDLSDEWVPLPKSPKSPKHIKRSYSFNTNLADLNTSNGLIVSNIINSPLVAPTQLSPGRMGRQNKQITKYSQWAEWFAYELRKIPNKLNSSSLEYLTCTIKELLKDLNLTDTIRIHGIVLAWNLHEIYNDRTLSAQLSSLIISNGIGFMNYIIWPRYNIKPNEALIATFNRMPTDIYSTVLTYLKLGGNILETNKTGQTMLKSLSDSHDMGYLDNSIYDSIYKLLISGTYQNRAYSILAEKVTGDSSQRELKNVANFISWAVITNCDMFCREVIKNLDSIPNETNNITKSHKIAHSCINKILKCIDSGSVYKSSKDFTSKELSEKFKNIMLFVLKELPIQLTKISGAIMAEVGNKSDVLEYIKINAQLCPLNSKIAFGTYKISNPEFICPIEIIDELIKLMEETSDESIRSGLVETVQYCIRCETANTPKDKKKKNTPKIKSSIDMSFYNEIIDSWEYETDEEIECTSSRSISSSPGSPLAQSFELDYLASHT